MTSNLKQQSNRRWADPRVKHEDHDKARELVLSNNCLSLVRNTKGNSLDESPDTKLKGVVTHSVKELKEDNNTNTQMK